MDTYVYMYMIHFNSSQETSPEHMSLRVCVGDRILLKDGKEWSVIEVDESIIMVQRSGKLYQRLPLGSTSIERILSSKVIAFSLIISAC